MAHKIGRSFKKEVLDDAFGIDENKTFGISNKTGIGKVLAKVTPGAKNNIFGQAGDFVEDKITQPVKEGVGGVVDLVTGKTAKKQREAQLQALRDQQSALEAKENEANRMALASTLLSRGKGKFFDITRPESVEEFLMDQEGEYLDPFPDYLRKSGDYLLGGLENAGENIENYTGTSDDMMRDFQPTFDRLRSANDSAVDRLQSIYDGRMENDIRGFQDRTNDITRQLQGLNTESAEMERALQQGVLDEAELYAKSLGDSVRMEESLANQRFDELDRIPEIMRQQNRELEGRFGDTYASEIDAARGLLGAEYGAADRILGAETSAADAIQRAERAKALAAGANAENMANSQQRGMRSAMVGQGRGTQANMGDAMIRAQLGQQRGDMLADALIRDAERRGKAGIDYAGRTGASDVGFAGRIGDAGIGQSTKLEDVLDTDAGLADAKIGAERYEALGEINPALADVYQNEAMLNRANTALGFGDTRLSARAQNLGLDQGMVDADQSIYNMIMNQQLSNTGMIPGMGMQTAMLPALYGEAALASQGPMARAVSPYTSTGTLPQGQTIFQNTPFTPAPEGPKKNWIDYLAQAPEYISKGKEVLGGIRDIFQ